MIYETRFVFIVFLLICTACSQIQENAASRTVRINIDSEPISLDPRKARDLDSSNILHMLFEGLTRTSLDGKTEMALARDVSISNDGLIYTFSLKKSNWSDGSPLTSFDFASSWKTILDPRFPTDVAYHFYPIKNARMAKLGKIGLDEVGIETPDPYTLILKLEQPTPYLPKVLSMTPFFPVPKNIASQNPRWCMEASHFICNGPFEIESWDHANQITLKKNNLYWEADRVQIPQIDLIVAAPDTGLRMFEEGKLDWIGSPLSEIPFAAIKELNLENKLRVSPFLATFFLRLNTEPKKEDRFNPLSNCFFRKALALSLDRSAITEHLLQGGQKPAKGLVPPEMDLNSKGYFLDNQLDEASRLLQMAKEQLGPLTEPIVISFSNSERNASIAQIIQKQWEERLQISVELQAIEPKVYFQKVSRRDFQLAIGSWTADFNDPVNFLEVFKYKENGTNNTGWENSQYIDLLNRSELCRDLEERKQLLREAEVILMDEMPLIPIYHFALNYLRRDELEDVLLSPLGHLDLKWARLELQRPSLQKR